MGHYGKSLLAIIIKRIGWLRKDFFENGNEPGLFQ